MLNYFSKRLTSFFILKKQIDENERERYDYSFELLLATIVNLLMIVTIGILIGSFFETVIFSIAFMSMRVVCGGFHAKTHFSCVLCLAFIFISMIFVSKLPISVLAPISIGMIVFSMVASFSLAPVDCVNKEIDDELRKRLKLKIYVLNIIIILTFIILFLFETTRY